jgi:hypothetical protein
MRQQRIARAQRRRRSARAERQRDMDLTSMVESEAVVMEEDVVLASAPMCDRQSLTVYSPTQIAGDDRPNAQEDACNA